MTKSDHLLEHVKVLLARREFESACALLDDPEVVGTQTDESSSLRWMTGMLAGDFAAAWQASDLIRGRGNPDPHRFWNGQSLEKKQVIVRCLHGLGDTVQMLRYAPLLAQRSTHVVYEVAPSMMEISTQFQDVNHVITWGANAPAKPPLWDIQLEVMELPYIFRTEARHLPIAESYLTVGPKISRATAERMGTKRLPRVGMVWAGGEWNSERSIPYAMFARLMNIAGIDFWNLQGSSAAKQAEGSVLRDAANICGDGLSALSATIAHMDLVITVDTLAAHLAGAMGKPVWVMLQHAADWRWMVNRSDSPWYPTMRLFRQAIPGDWSSAIDQVRAELIARYSLSGDQ